MTDLSPIRRALISVSNKSGLVEFGRALAAAGVELLSTGGSAKALRDAGVPVTEVSDHTGFPEILDGRVKTLVPQIHGGILGRRDLPKHLEQMAAHNIAPIDLVAVNLYPFEATVARGGAYDDCVENIDIGGSALIRAAAKNHDFVAVLTDPAQYETVLAEVAAHGGTTLATRRKLAGEAYARTAAYDAAIGAWFAGQQDMTFPPRMTVSGSLRQELRYGENPHQEAAFYVTGMRPGVATATQIQGKELSYNNLNDTDAAFECVAAEHRAEEFGQPLLAQQLARECARLVGQARQLPTACAHPREPFGDAGKHGRVHAVDTLVVLLIQRPRALVETGLGADLGERAADQVLGTLAHRAADESVRDVPQAERLECGVQGDDEVAEGIDHGAVEIDDGGVKVDWQCRL